MSYFDRVFGIPHQVQISQKRDATTGKLNTEHDLLKSEHGTPANVVTTSSIIQSIVTGKTFHLRNIIVDNTAAAAEQVSIYDGTVAAGTLELRINVAANESVAITDLVGVKFTDDIHAVVATSSAQVSIGGILEI